jgi:hypothetical protein
MDRLLLVDVVERARVVRLFFLSTLVRRLPE